MNVFTLYRFRRRFVCISSPHVISTAGYLENRTARESRRSEAPDGNAHSLFRIDVIVVISPSFMHISIEGH
jgi:hypothetical protein